MSPASSVDRRAAEATAACGIDLLGGACALVAPEARPAAAFSIAVALDRRPYARVETGHDRVRLASKDSLLQLEVGRVGDLPATGLPGLVRGVLLGLGLDRGVVVSTQARVPFGTGLGSAGALAIALAAAAARATGSSLSSEELAAFAVHGHALEPGLPAAGLAAVFGGVVAAAASPSGGAAVRLGVDPARIEECLLLVEVPSPEGGGDAFSAGGALEGEGRPEGNGPRTALGSALGEEATQRVRSGREALVAGRYAEIPALLEGDCASWRALLRERGPSSFDRLSQVVRGAGGMVRPGPGPQGLALVWAAPGERGPGPRERVTRALRAAAYRTFPCRVDLRGLEVEGG